MIPRDISRAIREALEEYPVVSLAGARQTGKSTLLRSMLPDWTYLSFEDPDLRALARDDPRDFLARHARHVILDEAQRVPELFSYLQTVVDQTGDAGQFVVSGSQNYLLLEQVSQSLAGRVALVTMAPLTRAELLAARPGDLSAPEKGARLLDAVRNDRWAWVLYGGYPRLYDYGVHPARYFADYVRTYVDRDVREELRVLKLAEFERFMGLCAARAGELINYSALASDAGVDVKTAKSWISALSASNILFELRPYSSNANARLVKSPKLYFMDTGLLCHLLGIDDTEALAAYAKRGNVFENAVIAEYAKCVQSSRGRLHASFYRTSGRDEEIDLVIERGLTPFAAFEVKSSATYNSKFFKNVSSVGEALDIPPERRGVIYNGDQVMVGGTRGLLITPDQIPGVVDESIFG